MALWTPAQLTTALWLDADDASTITTDGSGNVEQWNDKSGNGLNATQTNAGSRPFLQSAAQNGKDVIRFTNDNFDCGKTVANNAAFTIFAAARFDALTTNDFPVVWSFETSNGSPAIQLFATPLTGYAEYSFGSSGSQWVRGRFGTTASSGASSLFGVTYNGQGSTTLSNFKGFQNGGADSVSAAPNFATNTNATKIGSRSDGGIPMQGDIFEIIVLDFEASETDRQKIEGYLAHKWGLEANLPADHPYKSAAPTIAANVSGNARINETTASKLVVAFNPALTEIGRDTPDPASTPTVGAYELSLTSGPAYLQSHAFDPARWRGVWQPDTAYLEGDVVFTEANGEALVIECTTTGVSGSTPPAWNSIVGGTTDEGA